jgi:hypothetical protein
MRLRSSDLKEEEDDYDDETRGGDKTPLMIAALEGVPSVPERLGYQDLFGPHLKVLNALLRRGGDCHKLYHGRSAWDLARNEGHAEILELFEEYRGKPPPLPSVNGNRPDSRNGKDSSKSPTTQGGYRNGNESDSSTEAVAGRASPSHISTATETRRRRWRKSRRNAEIVSWRESLLEESLEHTTLRPQPPCCSLSQSVSSFSSSVEVIFELTHLRD